MVPSCWSFAFLNAYTAFNSDSQVSNFSDSEVMVLSDVVRISVNSSSKVLRTFSTSNFSWVWHLTSSSFSFMITSSLISISRWKYITMSCVSFSFCPELMRKSLLLWTNSSTLRVKKLIFSWSSWREIWKDGGNLPSSMLHKWENRTEDKSRVMIACKLNDLATTQTKRRKLKDMQNSLK